jgi:glycosyltransferase involved in cell wall biosynthesis
LPLSRANWLGTVPYGLELKHYQFCSARRDGYLAFLGGISPEKRPDRAIAIAKRANIKLKIAAKVSEVDRAYFQEAIVPLLDDPLIEFVGEIGDSEKSAFLGKARALLFPIDWPEPFGLAMIEAMACGTPVIAWNCGAVPEVIDHGVTGFIVASEVQAVAAVETVGFLNRSRIRSVCESRFSAAAMAGNYVALYHQLVGARLRRIS